MFTPPSHIVQVSDPRQYPCSGVSCSRRFHRVRPSFSSWAAVVSLDHTTRKYCGRGTETASKTPKFSNNGATVGSPQTQPAAFGCLIPKAAGTAALHSARVWGIGCCYFYSCFVLHLLLLFIYSFAIAIHLLIHGYQSPYLIHRQKEGGSHP